MKKGQRVYNGTHFASAFDNKISSILTVSSSLNPRTESLKLLPPTPTDPVKDPVKSVDSIEPIKLNSDPIEMPSIAALGSTVQPRPVSTVQPRPVSSVQPRPVSTAQSRPISHRMSVSSISDYAKVESKPSIQTLLSQRNPTKEVLGNNVKLIPFEKTLEMYKQNARETQDPVLHFEFAK